MSCLLFAGTVAAAQDSNKDTGSRAKAKAPVKLLFVYVAKSATLKHIKGKEYQLSFPVTANNKVLAFSDRPNRVAFTLTPEQWAKIIRAGPNSF